MKPALTIDIGTTSVKTCLFDAQGGLRAVRRSPTPTTSDRWGTVYDMDALVGLVLAFLRSLSEDDRRAVRRIAVAGVGESGGLVGPDLRLLSPVILWHDHRGSGVLERLSARDREEVYRVTGLPVNANYALSKVAWAVEHADDRSPDATWLNVSELLAAYLTGRRWAEYSLASRTMALDLRSRQWSPAVCDLLGVDVRLFPELRGASEGETVRSDLAAGEGLDPSVLVHVVGHDHMVGGVGADLRPGELLNSTGTTEGVLQLRAEPALDPVTAEAKLANGVACDAAGFTLFASIPTGGSIFRTLQRMLGMTPSSIGACLDRLCERYLAGRIDLASMPVVVPHFRGSPPPRKSSAARGVIANLGDDVTGDDIVFAAFLGMAVQYRAVLDLLPDPASLVKVIGPASHNELWLHLKADVLGTDHSVSEVEEVVSRGAQALASGERTSWVSCAPRTVEADAVRHDRLRRWYDDVRPSLERMEALTG